MIPFYFLNKRYTKIAAIKNKMNKIKKKKRMEKKIRKTRGMKDEVKV